MARSIPAVRAPCVARDAFPRHGQHLRVAHQVVQIIEPAGAVSARPAVQFVLNPPYRHERLAVARPRGGAGVHRRVFGPDSHFLLLSLSPFPRWSALPTSEYYGDSAPSTPFGRQRAYPRGGTVRRWFPRSLLFGRRARRPALPLRSRRGYAADLHHDLPGPTHSPSRQFPARAAAWLTAPGTVTHRTPAPIHRVRAGRRSRGFTTPVPHVHLPVSLTRHGPSGSAGPP